MTLRPLHRSLHSHLCVVALACGALVSGLHAHEPGLSSLQLSASADGHTLIKLQFSAADVATLLPEADSLRDGEIDQVEFIQGRAALDTLLARWLAVGPENAARLVIDQVTVLRDPASGDLIWNGTVDGAVDSPWEAELPLLNSLADGHHQRVTILDANGGVLAEHLLGGGSSVVRWEWPAPPDPLIETVNATPPPADAMVRFGAYFKLGIVHILHGYDHLLFLAGLLVASRRWGEMLGIITSFTVAHSITLGLAALDLIHIPGNWIEPLIAASIVYVGVENLLRQKEGPRGRWGLTFGFGLLHGFGFAGALREFGLGTDGRGVLAPLLGFNLGVEVGQFALAAAIVPLLAFARRSQAFELRVSPALSSLVVALGLYWLVERAIT